MPSPLIRALTDRVGFPVLDAGTVDGFLAAGSPEHALLFFTGDPVQRPEAADVARAAEPALMPRFRVAVLPSLVVTRGTDPVGVLPRVRDWSDYLARIEVYLAPDAPVLPPAARPDVRVSSTTTAVPA